MANRVLRDWTQSEFINSISEKSEVFFVRLIMKADDFGCFYGNIKLLKAALYPLRQITDSDLQKCLSECCKVGLIILYVVDGKQYVKINNFGQRLRTMRSKFPEPQLDTIIDSNSPTIDSNSPLETETESEKKPKQKQNPKPNIEDVKHYFLSNSYSELSAVKFFNYYESADWKDSNGKEVKNWKQKAQGVWFKPENKIDTPKSREEYYLNLRTS